MEQFGTETAAKSGAAMQREPQRGLTTTGGQATTVLKSLREVVKASNKVGRAVEVNAELETSLRQALGSRLVLEKRYNDDYSGLSSCTVKIKGECSTDMVEAVRFLNQTSGGSEVSQIVTKLYKSCAVKSEDDDEMEASLFVITEALCEYPIDVVKTVCRDWAYGKHRKEGQDVVFYPKPAEIRDICDGLMRLRRGVLQAMMCPIPIRKKEDGAATYKDIPKDRWTQETWDEYVKEAEQMVLLSGNMPHMLDHTGWKVTLAEREKGRAEALTRLMNAG